MTVRVGVAGTGMMGAAHVRALVGDVAGARVVALADADTARAGALVTELGMSGVDVSADARRLVGLPEVDAVLVASPDDTHEDLVTACLDAGTPVLCEKPLATTADSCLRVVEHEVRTGRRLVQLGYMRRFDPGYVAMKHAVDTGRIGTPLLAHCVHRNATALPWFTPAMPLLNSAVHEIDAVRWLLDTEITQVTVHTPGSTRHADIPDPRMILLETSTGVVVDTEVFVNARYGYDVRCELVGEDGTLSLAPPARIAVRSDGVDGRPVEDDFRDRFADAYRLQLRRWIESVRDDVPAGPHAWDGYLASRTAEACVVAAAEHRPVELPVVAPPLIYARPTGTSPTEDTERTSS